jgi:hypothetical protein
MTALRIVRADARLEPVARPLPPRREAPAPLRLGTRVRVTPPGDHPAEGHVWGVTREGSPRYTVMTDARRLLKEQPADRVAPLEN